MECRIDVEDQAGLYVVRVAGRLTDVQVPDLLRVCATHTPVQIDLTQLDSANGVGIEALRRVQKAGAEIVGATQFILLQLDASHAGRE
jgi:anti-anti-sigma regulatory factor